MTQEATGRILVVSTDESAIDQTVTLAKAIASHLRLRILEYLTSKVASVAEISDALDMPIATASLHLGNLEKAELVHSHTAPANADNNGFISAFMIQLFFTCPRVVPSIAIEASHLKCLSVLLLIIQLYPLAAWLAKIHTSAAQTPQYHFMIQIVIMPNLYGSHMAILNIISRTPSTDKMP